MTTPSDTLDLVDYRRRVNDLYGEVRLLDDDRRAWDRWRHGRDDLFRSHPQSALPVSARASFGGLHYFPFDPALRIRAEVVASEETVFELAHSGAGSSRFVRFGTAHFEAAGTALELALFWLDTYGGGLFVPFGDVTNGTTTYGGGRYLLDSAKGADLGTDGDRLVLDFNFAYHPSCVHDDRWSCPLAGAFNQLPIPIFAGERL